MLKAIKERHERDNEIIIIERSQLHKVKEIREELQKYENICGITHISIICTELLTLFDESKRHIENLVRDQEPLWNEYREEAIKFLSKLE